MSIFSLVSVYITLAGDIVLFPVNIVATSCNMSAFSAIGLQKGVIRARRHFKTNL